jgi:hypothetical protein
MERKERLILSAEEALARRIALGVIVKRPVKIWLQVIPGMFIFDYLKRSNEIRRFSRFFMPPRKIAMDAALAIGTGEKKEDRLTMVKEETASFLVDLGLNSPDVLEAETAVVGLLIDHYVSLLDAEGDTHPDLIKNALKSREEYEAFLDRLAALEDGVAQTIVRELALDDNFREKLQAEQQEADEQRRKEIDTIFLW